MTFVTKKVVCEIVDKVNKKVLKYNLIIIKFAPQKYLTRCLHGSDEAYLYFHWNTSFHMKAYILVCITFVLHQSNL